MLYEDRFLFREAQRQAPTKKEKGSSAELLEDFEKNARLFDQISPKSKFLEMLIREAK